MTSGPTTHELLVYYIGDTILMDVTCTDAKGNVIDLTNAGIEWYLDAADGSSAAVCTLNNGIEIAQDGPEAGKIEITVAAEVTAKYAPGYFKDQLRIITNAGIVATQMVGLIMFKQSLNAAVQWQAAATLAGSGHVRSP